MNHLLEKLLKNRNISSVNELKGDEKETFDRWQKTLSEKEMTLDELKEFCYNQVSIIENQWKDLSNTSEKNERLIIAHTIYKTLLDVISKPQKERESLELYLQNMLLDSPNML